MHAHSDPRTRILNLKYRMHVQTDTREELDEVLNHYGPQGFRPASIQRQPSGEYVAILTKGAGQ